MKPGEWGRALFQPETFDWGRQGTDAWRHAWQYGLGERAVAEPLGAAPLHLQPDLNARLHTRALALVAWLHQHRAHWQQPGDPEMDVLSADLAVVHDPAHPSGWDVRWVEFQAFTSVAATVDWLHTLAAAQWPDVAALDPHGAGLAPPDWTQAWRAWAAGGQPRAQVRVLEHAPQRQRTRWDFVALQQRHGWAVAEPGELQPAGREGLQCRLTGQPVTALVNRLVPPAYPARDSSAWQALQAQPSVRWHSPPALYERVHKGLMPAWHAADASQRLEAADVTAWAQLGCAPEDLVLKACLGLGGTGVELHLSLDRLEALARQAAPGAWMVQRRYQPLPVMVADDGVPVGLEIRLMLDTRQPLQPVCMSRVGRLSRLGAGAKANAGSWQGLPGEGVALLLSPRGLRGSPASPMAV
jgi:hypothetical protein